MDDYFFAPERFEADGFVLRSYRIGDGPLLNDAVRTSYDHLKHFMVWATPNPPLTESERFCRLSLAHYLIGDNFTLGIFSPKEDRLLGGTGFHLRERSFEHHIGEIGMWIRGDAAGKGLGTRALKAMLEWGFTAWPWRRLFWRCDVENIASARTAEKAGLQKEGTIRADIIDGQNGMHDTHFFGLMRDEWLAARGNNANGK